MRPALLRRLARVAAAVLPAGAAVAAAASEPGSCSGAAAAAEAPVGGFSLLAVQQERLAGKAALAHDATAGQSCKLPPAARWCKVHLANLPVFSMATYKNDDSVSNQVCSSGFWETNDVSQYGRPGHALDIGGGIGFYTLALAQAGWTVSLFDPHPGNTKLLRASLCQNPHLAPRISINNFGLGWRQERCVLISQISRVGNGRSLCGPLARDMIPAGYVLRGEFMTRRLDDVLERQRVGAVNFVRMDAEGSECQIWQGAPSLRSRYRPRLIQSKVWPVLGECNPEDFVGQVISEGFFMSYNATCKEVIVDPGVSMVEQVSICRNTTATAKEHYSWMARRKI